MSLLPPGTLALGWQRFHDLAETDPEAFRRRLRQPQHFLTMDGTRFAPLRLLRELGSGLPFPPPQNDPIPFARLRKDLAKQGWQTVENGEPGFEHLFESWRADCLTHGSDNAPRNWRGSDPRNGRTFTYHP